MDRQMAEDGQRHTNIHSLFQNWHIKTLDIQLQSECDIILTPKNHSWVRPWNIMLWNRSLLSYMIIFQILKSSGRWLPRSECIKLLHKTLK